MSRHTNNEWRLFHCSQLINHKYNLVVIILRSGYSAKAIFAIRMKLLFTATFSFLSILLFAQDTIHPADKHLSFHWQATVIPQYHFKFYSPYQGTNSLLPDEPIKPSFTSTFFINYKPFKNTYIVFDPEAAGGYGFSQTLGLAGFSNGEIYRVGDPKPQPYIARLYIEQRLPLTQRKENVEDDQNQIRETTYADYFSIALGKFSLSDFFDASEICNDPRVQFLNWALMGSGSWDYPANTRGYTMGMVAQYIYHDFHLRGALTTVPMEANGPELQFIWNKAMGMIIEFEKKKLIYTNDRFYIDGSLGIYQNIAHMGNYAEAIKNGLTSFSAPDVISTRAYGRTKTGFYISVDNHLNKVHHYINYSWNDGKNETFAFTEIDRSFATGFQFDGSIWKRKKDFAGIAYVNNGLSNDHRTYLANGGYGFIIGDGRLNYGHEQIIEAYYSWNVWKKLFVSPDYQFAMHPAYNKDRGPVHIVAIRFHIEI